MSYSHLFVLDPLVKAREDRDGVFDYYRDNLVYILANDELLSDEYALLKAIAINVHFNFDEYAMTIINNRMIEKSLPKTDKTKHDFLQHLAVLILVCSDKCRTEDVIIFDAIARKYGYSLKVLDDVVNTVVSRIGNSNEHLIALKDNIISSYARAKEVDRKMFINAYLRESEDSKKWRNIPF